MSKKQLLKDNILVFVGANIANGLNYLLNIYLARNNTKLFNLYTAYTSVSLILLVPSLVTMRIFTVYGNSTIENLRSYYIRNKNKALWILILFTLSLIPFNYLLTKYTVEGTIFTSLLLIAIAVIGVIANIFRGIRQNAEDYKISVLSLNLEAVGRLVLGLIFAVFLGLGISGILIGHSLGLVASLIVCFDRKYFDLNLKANNEIKLKSLFINTLLMTGALEFFSNFDIIYSNYILRNTVNAQTEFNTLQFFRKIIFFGIFAVSSIVLSIGGKGKHTKLFTFLFTLAIGMTIGIGMGGFFFIFRNFVFGFLKQNIELISAKQQILFLIGTVMMSSAYLLSNWLFTTKKTKFIYLPVIASALQVFIFLLFSANLNTLLVSFFVSSLLFFLITLSAGIIEVITSQKTEIIYT